MYTMKLMIIRHGDPDYAHDSLTSIGFQQAELLGKYLQGMKLDEIYLSPYGRAQDTAKPYLRLTNRKPDGVYDWLKELPHTWDLKPEEWIYDPLSLDMHRFLEIPTIQNRFSGEGKQLAETLKTVESDFYAFMEQHGYIAKERYFEVTKPGNEETVVFFSHLGCGSFLLSRLVFTSPLFFWQNGFMGSSSIAIAQTEEREPGRAIWRIRSFGALPHLSGHPELSTEAGAFRETALTPGRWEK